MGRMELKSLKAKGNKVLQYVNKLDKLFIKDDAMFYKF